MNHDVSLDTQLNIQDDYLILKVKAIRKPIINLDVTIDSFKVFGVTNMLIKAGNKLKLEIRPTDAFGNPARVEGQPVWTLNDPSLGSLDVSVSGTEVIFSSIGKVGQVVIDVAADADLSEGIRNIGGSLTVDIEAGEAVDLGVFAEPVVIEVAPVEAPVDEPVADAAVADEPAVDAAVADEPVVEPTVDGTDSEAEADAIAAAATAANATVDPAAVEGTEENPIV